MIRSLGGLGIIALAIVLTACFGGGAAAPTGSTVARSSPSPTPTLDGDWIAQVADPSSACIGIGYRVVHIAEGTASATPAIVGSPASAPGLTGPATLQGSTATLHLERSTPTKDALDIAGALGADGIIQGTAKAGGIHPGGTNGYTCEFAITLVPAVGPADMPAFDSISGTWCTADDPSTCMTIASGRVGFGDDPPDATLDPPRAGGGFGDPCYVTAATPDQPGGGFAIYFCPKGVVIQPGSGGVEGEIVAAHDNVAFDRVYGTQNPPYLQVYFRKEEIAAATAP